MGAWVVFFRRMGGGSSKFKLSSPLPIEIGQAGAKAEEYAHAFLSELVRLAEERMREVDEVNRAYERKATLMASLGVAVFGYLLSGIPRFEVPGLDASLWGWIIYFSFGLVVFFSAKTIDLSSYAARGLHPDVIRGFFKREPAGNETNWTLYYMLEQYRKGLDKNIYGTYGKYKCLLCAKFFLVTGASGCIGMAFELAEISPQICRWLAQY